MHGEGKLLQRNGVASLPAFRLVFPWEAQSQFEKHLPSIRSGKTQALRYTFAIPTPLRSGLRCEAICPEMTQTTHQASPRSCGSPETFPSLEAGSARSGRPATACSGSNHTQTGYLRFVANHMKCNIIDLRRIRPWKSRTLCSTRG